MINLLEVGRATLDHGGWPSRRWRRIRFSMTG